MANRGEGSATGGRDSRWLAAVGYGGVAVVVVGGWALLFVGSGDKTPLDTWLYFWPVYIATAERFARGVVPLWNPYQLCGIPWVATLQGGVFYPLHVLYVALPIHLAFMLSNVVHLVLIGVATAVFVRRLGLGMASALVAAVLLTLRGNVPMLLFAPNHLEAYSWLPVGAIACVDLVRRPGRGPIALLAVSTGMSLLAGYPQPTVYLTYAWASLVLALLLEARPDAWGVLRVIGRFASGIALGGMLAAVQMAPAAELTRLAVRAPGELAERAMFPVAANFSPALIPLRFGAIAGVPWSFGVVALALLPAALAATRRRAIAWWAVVLAVVTVLFALGGITPAFSVYLALPALRWFRIPSRIIALTEFAVAIAAAFGLDAITGAGSRLGRRVAAVVGILAVGGIVRLAAEGWAPPETWQRVVTHASIVVAALAIAAIGSTGARAVAIAALVSLVLYEVGTTPRVDMQLPYAATDVERLHVYEKPLRALAARAGHDRVWRYGWMLQPEDGLKLPTLYGVRAINDYEPINLERQANLFTYFTEGSTTTTRPPWLFSGAVSTLEAPPGVTPPQWRRRLVDLTAMRFFVIGAGLRLGNPAVAAFLDAGGFRLVEDGPRLKVFENPSALPRAFVTYRTRRAPERADDVLRALSDPAFDPLVESYVEGEPIPAADAPRGHPATIVRDGESEVELEATLERPGLVVLADSFYPGWHATVDGAAAPILATNHLFRGVPAGPGTHRIRFVYAPASVRLGAACTALALVVLAWLVRTRSA